MTTRTPTPIDEPFHLTDNDPNITETDGTANTWSDLWKYQVPVGTALRLAADNTFAAYIEDASAEIGNSDAQVRIRVRDPAETENIVVYGPALYLKSKEFQDRPLKAHLGVQEYIVRERHWLVFECKDNGTIDASDSYFELLTSRIRAGGL